MSQIIRKTAALQGSSITERDIQLINKHTIKPLAGDDVYVFKAIMCDNEIDREHEVFPLASLEKLAVLFVGKTVIANHEWKSAAQKARIYATEVTTDSAETETGESKSQLIAYCYMLRTESNKDLIAEIDAGIKKEVSVGCRCSKAVCSICKTDNRKMYCEHMPGREYGGKKCYFLLADPTDAYELSFVAVPAQPGAGITKAYGDTPYSPDVMKSESKDTDMKEALSIQLDLLDSFIFLANEMEEINNE